MKRLGNGNQYSKLYRQLNWIAYMLCFVFFSTHFTACKNSNTQKELPTNSIETANTFIRAGLESDFTLASSLLAPGELNQQAFEQWKKGISSLPAAQKIRNETAFYTVKSIEERGDSLMIVTYQTGYDTTATSIHLKQIQSKWVVDLIQNR